MDTPTPASSGASWKIGVLIGCLGAAFLAVIFAIAVLVPVLLRSSPSTTSQPPEATQSVSDRQSPPVARPPASSAGPIVLENLFADRSFGSMGYPADWFFRREPQGGTYFHKRNCPPEQVAVAIQSFRADQGTGPAAVLDSMAAEMRRTAQSEFPDSKFSTIGEAGLRGKAGRQFTCEGPPATPLRRHFVLLLDPTGTQICVWCSVFPADAPPAIRNEVAAMLESLTVSQQEATGPRPPLQRLPDDTFGEPEPVRPASTGRGL